MRALRAIQRRAMRDEQADEKHAPAGAEPPPDPHPRRIATVENARTAPLTQEIPVSPDVTIGQFDNGLRYYIRQNHEPENRAQLRLVVRVGSIVEDDDQLGLAHFTEHIAFNGTENYAKQELVEFLESLGMRLGADVNASTSFDETVCQLEVPTDDPTALAAGIQILEDWAHGLTLDEEEIESERGAVIEEWRLGQGASTRIRDQQFPVLLEGSRYVDRSPIGTLESLQSFDPEALRRFYRDWYRPDLMAVVAVGDFAVDEVESLVRQHFAGLLNPAEPRPRETFPVPDHDGTRFTIVTDVEMPRASVAVYHMMESWDETTLDAYRQSIVERLYNTMINQRFQELSRQPDPPFVFGQSTRGRLIGSKGAYMLVAGVQEEGIERGLDALFTEAERVARFGFTESELARQKVAALRGMERSYANRSDRSSGGFVAEYIRAFLQNESIPGIGYENELFKRFVPEITLEEVNAIGRDWIHDDNRVIAVTAPEKDDLEIPGEDDLLAVLDGVRSKSITAYVEAFVDRPLLADPPVGSAVVSERTLEGGVTEWELANGVTVAFKPTDFRADEVVFRGVSPGGTSLATDDEYSAARIATAIVSGGGLSDFNAIELRKVLTGKVVSVRPSISEFEEGVSGGASPQDLETLFQLIYLNFTAPRADPEFF